MATNSDNWRHLDGEFEVFLRGAELEYKPKNQVEIDIVRCIASYWWHLRPGRSP